MRSVFKFVSVALVAASVGWLYAADGPIQGQWTAQLKAGRVYLQLQRDTTDGGRGSGSSWGQTLPADQLVGRSWQDDHLTFDTIHFELRREAGTIAFGGAFRDGRGTGFFTFSPRAAFGAEMNALGYTDELPAWRLFQFTLADVGPRFIGDLKSLGYSSLSLDLVYRMRTHGISVNFIKGLNALGYARIEAETLVRARDHGVSAEDAAAIRKAGYPNVSLEGLVRLRDHGVSMDDVDELDRHGYTQVPLEDLIRLRDHGVGGDYIADLKSLGLKNLTIDDLVRMRDHGVSPSFVRLMQAHAHRDASAEELIRLRDHGADWPE